MTELDIEERHPELPHTLTRTQLTAALVLVTLLPFLLVVFMYSNLPYESDPELLVDIEVGPRAWPNDQAEDARLLPCVTIKNATEEDWNYVNLSINHQFHFKLHPTELLSGEEAFVPLKWFHTKGNAYFPPESQELKELTIYAQVPSGARAIKELKGEVLNFRQ
ncbi:MAG: hypothetical protein AAF483_00825 [Planctomycetota bacterium]